MTERESIKLWSTTAASNATADGNINWTEGQAPSTVNNSTRAMMAALAREFKDTNGSLTTTGSANAYLLTINNTWTAYATGQVISFKASFSNSGAATINVTNADAAALGAKAIRAGGDVALNSDQIVSGGHYLLQYDAAANSAAGAWIVLNPSAGTGAARDVLSADLNVYVRTDGSDSNTGLANTSGAAFLTIQKAINVIANNYDLRGYQAIINVADGTYSTAGYNVLVNGTFTGAAQRATTFPSNGVPPVIIRGNTTTPANVTITSTGSDAFVCVLYGCIGVEGCTVTAPAGIAFHTGANGTILVGKNTIGVAGVAKIFSSHSGVIELYDTLSITGNSGYVLDAEYGGEIYASGITITQLANLTVTAFARSCGASEINYQGVTFTTGGFTLTGKKFEIDNGGTIRTFTADLTTFPGTLPGTVTSGGSYDTLSYETAARTINANAAAVTAPSLGNMLQLANNDSNHTVLTMDSYGSANFGFTQIRRARGTGAAPTKLLSGDFFGSYGMVGYATTAGFVVSSGIVYAKAKEDFNGSSNLGTSLLFNTTPIASGTARIAAELYDGALTLGVAGVNLGSLLLSGNTSGTATITPQATAGSPTLTLPNVSGTFAVSASSPLTLNATTGNLTLGVILAANFPALTGDVTTVSGALATTLATVNSNVGTFGSATQASQVTVNAKGLVTAAANVTVTPAVGSITGLGTGVATALAINVGSAGAPVTFNGAGGTPSSLTLTNATALPVAGITSSTSTALGVGSLEVGHASDTTITRVSAGVIAIEGIPVGRTFVLSFTRDLTAATASVSYTGVGFKPTSLIASGCVGGSANYGQASGFCDSALNQGSVNLTAIGGIVATSAFIRAIESTFANSQVGTVTSMDSDGFTISWVKTGSPTGTATYYVLCRT